MSARPIPRLCALALAAVAGCATSNKIVSLEMPNQAIPPTQYVDQIKRWSRHGDLLSDFDATMIADATFRSPEFCSAYTAKYLEVYRVPEAHRAQVASTIPTTPDTYEFHLETQTHTWEVNQLKPPKTIWRVTLLDDRGREVQMKEIKEENTRPEFLRIFYPYNDTFSKPWRLLFPRALPDGAPLVTPETKSLTLRIAGPVGAIDLVWRLQ